MSAFQRAAARAIDSDPSLAQPPSQGRPVLSADELKESRWFGERGAVYVNRDTGRRYRPHNNAERDFVLGDRPRRYLLKGGEGSGKSVAGIIKDLERLRRGMSGIMGSPDFVHFRKSLWKEFQRWCPPNALVAKHRYRLQLDWAPQQPFELIFEDVGYGHGTLLCGGFDKPGSWEGPNVNFAHFDEARHHPGPQMAKVLDGRCRIPGPGGIPPQWWITTTPRKSRLSLSPEDMEHHWLFEMFGPWQGSAGEEDPFAAFKANAAVLTLRLIENAPNLAEGYAEERRNSLREKEARVLADAEWEDEEDTERFLPNMYWWDQCERPLPALTPNDRVVLALDAAIGRKSSASDCFGVVAVSRLPGSNPREGLVAIRFAQKWQAKAGEKIDFQGTEQHPGPERVVRHLIHNTNVKCIVYDQYQLADMMNRIEKEERVWCAAFSQQSDRLIADKGLLDLITARRVAQDGHPDLRAHIDNADRKVDADGSRFRLVQGRGKIDLAVCSSMGAAQCLELNL